MQNVFMIRVDFTSINDTEKLLDVSFHGAFKSYISASEWLINEGFEVYFDDHSSEFLEEETIGFYYKDNVTEQYATIETFNIYE